MAAYKRKMKMGNPPRVSAKLTGLPLPSIILNREPVAAMATTMEPDNNSGDGTSMGYSSTSSCCCSANRAVGDDCCNGSIVSFKEDDDDDDDKLSVVGVNSSRVSSLPGGGVVDHSDVVSARLVVVLEVGTGTRGSPLILWIAVAAVRLGAVVKA